MDPTKTKCVLHNPYHPLKYFKSWKKIKVGKEGKMFCTLYTKENLRYHQVVDKKDVKFVFGNGDSSNKYRIKTHRRG
jgi:hypothetical protein